MTRNRSSPSSDDARAERGEAGPATGHGPVRRPARRVVAHAAVAAVLTGALLWLVPVVDVAVAFILLAFAACLAAVDAFVPSGAPPKRSRGTVRPYGTLRAWTVFKAVLFFAYGLLFILPTLFVAAGLHGLWTNEAWVHQGVERVIVVYGVAAVVLVAFLARQVASLPLDAFLPRGSRIAAALCFCVVVLAAAAAAYGAVEARLAQAAVLFGVAAWALLGLLLVARPIPSLRDLFSDERGVYSGPTHLTHAKSFWMPFLGACAAVFWSLLVVGIFGLGTQGLQAGVGSPLFWGVLATTVALATAATVAAGSIVGRKDTLPVYRTAVTKEQRRLKILFATSACLVSAALILMTLALLGKGVAGFRPGPGRWVEFLALAVMFAVGPYGFYYAYRQRRVRLLEERFPGFLRDLAAARRAGLTLEQAIMMARRGDYGHLGPEIEKMADQLSWKMPFEAVLQEFSDRVRTPLIERSVSLIKEASWTGGNIASVLEAAAKDAQEVQEINSERYTATRVYAGIVYIGFFIFLGVAGVLYVNLVPELVEAAHQVGEQGTERNRIQGLAVNPDITLTDFRVFYFIAALAQGIGGGFVAGLMGSGNWPNGLRHIFFMSAMTLGVFVFLAG